MSIRDTINSGTLIERTLLLLLLGILGYACLQVIAPFVTPFIWAVILTLSTWPWYLSLSGWLGNRRNLAAALLTGLMLLVFVIPVTRAIDATLEFLPHTETWINQTLDWLNGEPPAWVKSIPWVGEKLDQDWHSGKIRSMLDPGRVRPVLATAGKWLFQQGTGLALNAINIILAVLMAGLLYSHGEKAVEVARKLARRIGGTPGVEATRIAADTIRGVSLGVIGTALIQALLSGFGFMLAGLPAAPMLGLLCFLLAVMQMGTGLIWIPAAAWLTYQGHGGWAGFTVAWGLFINIMDNFIKPYFIGRSSALPFLLIMVGVIGGLLAWGFVGIFLGTTLLAVAYATFFAWLDTPASQD